MEERPESRKIASEPCPECGSRDNLARYDDGHAFCFTPGCGHYEPGDGQDTPRQPQPRARMDLIPGETSALPNRGLMRETCERYGYQVGTLANGTAVHLAPYRDPSGRIIAQKVRPADKSKMFVSGDGQHGRLFGQSLLRADGGKMVVVTEGELDALSVSQALNNRWPVVSIPSGAGNARRDLAPHIADLEKYDAVVLSFDMDAAGRTAVDECAPLFTPGKVRIAHLPDDVKDANDLVKANRSKELSDAIWGASAWTPDVLNDLDDDLLAEASEEQPWGLPWPWVTLTRATYGIQRAACYTWGAGTGAGKTTLVKQLALAAIRPDLGEAHDFLPIPSPRPVATILYEEPIKRTLKTMAGMAMGQRIHVPGTVYDKDLARRTMEELRPFLKSISLKGARNWETVKATIRFLTVSENVRDFIIDPMTALTAGDENERSTLDGIMSEMAELAEDLDITIHLVFHLATPDGTSHEDGGRVQEKHFRGSRAVAFWSHYLLGVERNKQDPESPTVIRGLKDRLTGDAIGPLIALTYDRETGLMVEVPLPEGDSNNPFKDETKHEDI